MEIDGGPEVLEVPESAGHLLELLDLGLESFADGVGDRMLVEVQDAVQMSMDAAGCVDGSSAWGRRGGASLHNSDTETDIPSRAPPRCPPGLLSWRARPCSPTRETKGPGSCDRTRRRACSFPPWVTIFPKRERVVEHNNENPSASRLGDELTSREGDGSAGSPPSASGARAFALLRLRTWRAPRRLFASIHPRK